MWGLIASTAMSFGTSWYQSYIQKAQYDAQDTIHRANADSANLVNNTNADAANLVRKANNVFQAAQASLQNAQRSISNKERMGSFGDQWNAIETNQSRIMDNMVRGSLATQMKAAADLGALRAEASSRGVGGSSAAIMRSVAAVAQGHASTQASDNQKYVTYDALMQKSGLLRASINSLDMGQSLPTLDYGVNVAPLVQAPINPGDFINPSRDALRQNAMGLLKAGSSLLGGMFSGGGALAQSGTTSSFGISPLNSSGGASLTDTLRGSGDMASSGTFFKMA